MNPQLDTLEEIHATLIQLRQEARTQRRFPQKLWEAIIRLTQVHSIETICLHLNISPAYLKRKIRQTQESPSINFQEISHSIQGAGSDITVVELSSNSGLRARIQGPLSCLNCLHSLFRG